jgi:HlyD family secretion protein
MKQQYAVLHKSLILVFLSLLLVGILAACTTGGEEEQETPTESIPSLTQELSASGEVVPVKWVVLTYPSGATDLIVKVAEGDEVTQNEVLVQSDDPRLLAALYQAESTLARAQFAYDQVNNPPSEAALASARSAVANAEANLDRQDSIGASDLFVDAAQADLDAAQAALDELQKRASSTELAAVENDLKAAEYALQQAKEAFDLKAPFTGRIVELYVKDGEAIGAFQPVLTLADLSVLQVVTTDLSEVDVARLRVGQTANIVFDAISDRTFSATIEKIADKSTGVSSVYYEVTLSLAEIPAELRWGMTAFIVFPIQ